MNRIAKTALLTALVALVPALAAAHCQVPCGIFDDAARIIRMTEDAATIEKAMVQITALAAADDALSANQLARWVTVKEEHASNIITTVAEYFLAQKVKPVAPDAEGYAAYLQRLADHHAVMTAAMKTKQNVDPGFVTALREALERMSTHYDMDHTHAH